MPCPPTIRTASPSLPNDCARRPEELISDPLPTVRPPLPPFATIASSPQQKQPCHRRPPQVPRHAPPLSANRPPPPRGNWLDSTGPEMFPATPPPYSSPSILHALLRHPPRLAPLDRLSRQTRSPPRLPSPPLELCLRPGLAARWTLAPGDWPNPSRMLDHSRRFHDTAGTSSGRPPIGHLRPTAISARTADQLNREPRQPLPSLRHRPSAGTPSSVRDRRPPVSASLVVAPFGKSVVPYRPAGTGLLNFPPARDGITTRRRLATAALYTPWQAPSSSPTASPFDAPPRGISLRTHAEQRAAQALHPPATTPTYVEGHRSSPSNIIRSGSTTPTDLPTPPPGPLAHAGPAEAQLLGDLLDMHLKHTVRPRHPAERLAPCRLLPSPKT